LASLPENACVPVMDNNFPDVAIRRESDAFVCEIREHLYTKYWEHKFSAYAFAEAMERAVRRLANEGHPLANPTRDDEDVHIFVTWEFRAPCATPVDALVDSIKAAFDLVRAAGWRGGRAARAGRGCRWAALGVPGRS
jgi:hypothetical protein